MREGHHRVGAVDHRELPPDQRATDRSVADDPSSVGSGHAVAVGRRCGRRHLAGRAGPGLAGRGGLVKPRDRNGRNPDDRERQRGQLYRDCRRVELRSDDVAEHGRIRQREREQPEHAEPEPLATRAEPAQSQRPGMSGRARIRWRQPSHLCSCTDAATNLSAWPCPQAFVDLLGRSPAKQ